MSSEFPHENKRIDCINVTRHASKRVVLTGVNALSCVALIHSTIFSRAYLSYKAPLFINECQMQERDWCGHQWSIYFARVVKISHGAAIFRASHRKANFVNVLRSVTPWPLGWVCLSKLYFSTAGIEPTACLRTTLSSPGSVLSLGERTVARFTYPSCTP